MPDLSKKKDRLDLPERREPYWQRMHRYCYLGFRRGADTWIARYTHRNGSKHRYEYKQLDAENFDAAKEVAETWFASIGSSPAKRAIRGTVRGALEAYAEYLDQQGRQPTAENARERFRLIIDSDPIADIELEDLSQHDFEEWRQRLRAGRQNHSVNRHVRSVVAGLNVAVKRRGYRGDLEAWSVEPLFEEKSDDALDTVFLELKQRSAIRKAASPACAVFLEAIEHTGGRPGELAAATVDDLDRKQGTLTLSHKKGRPPKLRSRHVVLSDSALAFFQRQTRGKMPTAPLLLDPNGNQWGRHKWADEVFVLFCTKGIHGISEYFRGSRSQ